MHNRQRKISVPLSCALLVTALVTGRVSPAVRGAPVPVLAAPAAIDCEGNACSQVTLTWDETKQQYLAQNNSADRAVRVEGSNWAGGASVRVAPGKSDYLALKNIVGAYHANYA